MSSDFHFAPHLPSQPRFPTFQAEPKPHGFFSECRCQITAVRLGLPQVSTPPVNPLPFRTDRLCSEPAESPKFDNYQKFLARFLDEHDGLKRFYKDPLEDVFRRAQETGDRLIAAGCTAELWPELSLLSLYDIVVLIGVH